MDNNAAGKTRISVVVEDPRSPSSLVPMLVVGLVLAVIGIIVAAAVS